MLLARARMLAGIEKGKQRVLDPVSSVLPGLQTLERQIDIILLEQGILGSVVSRSYDKMTRASVSFFKRIDRKLPTWV